MYYPPLFPTVSPFDARSNPLGGAVDVPVVGPGRENPLDLSVKPIRQTPETGVEGEDLLMLDHRKLANLAAASHSLSAMGRQLAPGAATALLDPSLYRLSYAPEALVPPPFCYDRTTGVAVPTSLAGHQLLTTFLHQQQRDRCLEQQQALLAARTTAQQAAVAAAFMDPSLSFNLRSAMTQREAAAALAATRGMYPPTFPTPIVLPGFPLYADDKGAFSSLRSGTIDKNYMNGNTASAALEAARFAEQLQRLREQHLQQAGKCVNACCSSLSSGLVPTVPCACCIQSPSQAALCARSPVGCLKDPTTGATAGKTCNTTCDYLQPGLSFLHRPTAATAAPNDLRLPVPGFCSTTSSFANTTGSTETTTSLPLFQPVTTTSTSGLPGSSASGKTAFSVPKKKDPPKESFTQKDHKIVNGTKDYFSDNVRQESHKREPEKITSAISVKKETPRSNECDVFISDSLPFPYQRKAHDVKSLLTPKSSTTFASRPTAHIHSHTSHAQTTVTAATPIVPTKCEGGTIPKTKMPPVLQSYKPSEPPAHNSKHFVDVPTSVPSPQGPPPLVAVSTSSLHYKNSVSTFTNAMNFKDNAYHAPDPSVLRHHSFMPTSTTTTASYKNVSSSDKYSSFDSLSHQKASKNNMSHANPNVMSNYVKEEPGMNVTSTCAASMPKPTPQVPAAHNSASAAQYPSHYAPYSYQNHISWIPPAHPNVTVAPVLPKAAPTTPPKNIPVKPPKNTQTPITVMATPTMVGQKVMKSEPLPEVKREPDCYNSNVLQSLLVRPAVPTSAVVSQQQIPQSVIMPNPSSYPLLEYQYRMFHGLNLTNSSNTKAPDDPSATGNSPASAATAPTLKVEPKSEFVNFHNSPSKRLNFTPTKNDVVNKKRCSNVEPSSAYAFQYQSFTPEVKDSSTQCPYSFVLESPSFYENQTVIRRDVSSYKAVDYSSATPHSASIIQDDRKMSCQDVPVSYPSEVSQLSFLADMCRKNKRRHFYAKRRCRLLKRILAHIYGKRKAMSLTIPQEELAPVPSKVLWRHQRYLCKMVRRRRRIKSGLDMAMKSKRQKRVQDSSLLYRIQRRDLLKVPEIDHSVPECSGQSGAIPIPAEMKKLIVNRALGETVLHKAARLGYSEVVAYCLETNCGNVNSRDNAGYTPLHECCCRGHIDIARALLQYGADVNASAAGGIRPLHDAVENDHVEVVRLLLSFGADPSISTYSGLTPLKLARSPLMAEFLQGFIADVSGEIENRPYLPWRFWGSSSVLDPEVNGYDIIEGAPIDGEMEGETDDFLFEVSDSPHLPTFRLALPIDAKVPCNYLRLSDILRKTSLTKEYFLECYSHIDVLTVSRHEFEATASCSQLLSGTKLDNVLTTSEHFDRLDASHTVDLVRLDHNIRTVLGIETISVR